MDPHEPDAVPQRTPDASGVTRVSLFGRLKSDEAADRQAAWSDFRTRYAPMIAGFARRCGASRQDIDDIVQDVMTNFVAVAGGFVYDPAKGRFRGWLKTCTVRAAIRRAGKNMRFQGVPLDSVPDIELAVEPLWNDIWAKQIVAQALAAIRQRYDNNATFQAFEQYVLHDRPPTTVAAELGISVERVYQAKTRITRELRERMIEDDL